MDRVRSSLLRTRERMQTLNENTQSSPGEYAELQLRSGAEATVRRTMQGLRNTAKAVKSTAKTTKQTAQTTAKTSKVTAQTSQATARATAQAIRVTAKAIAAAAKAIAEGVKELVSAIAAGGWVSVVIAVVICLIGALVAYFGIFFSSEDTGSGRTMQAVVQEINEEYQAKLDGIRNSISCDTLEMSGSMAVWPEVLSVYAVKITSDPDNPQEAATITDEKEEILRDIFWEMNRITHSLSTRDVPVTIESVDENGNIVEEVVMETRTTLRIRVSHKTAEDMASLYNFNTDQREHLDALLAEGTVSMWAAVLYGVYGEDDQIVSVALSQLGNIGGRPYWSWYGFDSHVEWCTCFVSWCADQCGYIETGVIPKFASCNSGIRWFKSHGQWADGSLEPAPGMIIFFDWDSPDGISDHVGIVEKVENGRVYTIEGNANDRCARLSYPLGHHEIMGYGIPAY